MLSIADGTLEYGDGAAPSWPCNCMRVLTTSTGFVQIIAPTALLPAQRNSPHQGRGGVEVLLAESAMVLLADIVRHGASLVTDLCRVIAGPTGRGMYRDKLWDRTEVGANDLPPPRVDYFQLKLLPFKNQVTQ